MKECLILLLFIKCVFSATQCCWENRVIAPGAFCENSTSRINLNCPLGHMLLRHILLTGDKISTEDTPNYVFSEDPKDYCVGEMYKNVTNKDLGRIRVAVVCFQAPKAREIQASGILTLISVIFLLATFAVYSYLPQLRDLQGLCYMCMCISMALGFLSLGALQLTPAFTGLVCTASGFIIYFWMMATFFWMNTICINNYRTIVNSNYLKKTEKKQWFYYNAYAWGSTILFFIVAVITNFVEGDHYKPGFSELSCWLNGRTETWIFFYGPILCLIVANIILFMLSSYTLSRDARKYETSIINNLKYRFLLSLKLFLVMGISWVFEVASFAHNEYHIIWQIADTFNCLQGIVIFVLLVILRKRAIKGLANASCCLSITRPLAEKLSPHDDEREQQILEDDTEVQLN